MGRSVDLNGVYIPSEFIVARVIEDELIIVPLVSGIADMDEEMYTLNDTGKAIWERLDGQKNLRDIAKELSGEYHASGGDIEADVIGLTDELLKRRIVVEA